MICWRGKHKTNYFDVEALLIDIMQFREINVDTRLILTGIVIDKLKDGDILSIRKYLQSLDETIANLLMSLPSQPVFMMKLVKEAVDKRLFSRITEQDMALMIRRAYNELKLLDQPEIAGEKVERFLTAYRKYYKPGADDIDHVSRTISSISFLPRNTTPAIHGRLFLMMFFYPNPVLCRLRLHGRRAAGGRGYNRQQCR